jgi:hypothetical protein
MRESWQQVNGRRYANDKYISSFPTLLPEEQQEILDKKLISRFDSSLLVDDVNPNYLVNREVVRSLCKGDLSNLSVAKTNKDIKLSTGFIYWADNFCWIQNPRAEDITKKNIPFLLWDYQERAAEEIIRAIVFGYDLPIEKSRDMGLSWLLVAIFVWGWHFHGFDILVGSQKAENVDTRGNIKTLLEKARYIISRSPNWLLPELQDKKHDKSMLLVHPSSSATFAGESNNINFGRSDRRKAILFDEFASWEMTDRAAWQSCGSSTSCRIPLSTANTRGTNCHFFTVVNNAKKKDNPYLRLHWTLHPLFAQGLYYDDLGNARSPWYDEQCKRASTLQEVHQELDIDYEASAGDKVFPMFSIDSNVKDDLVYNPQLPLYISADFGLDTTAFVWWQEDKSKGMFYIIDEYQNNGAGDGTSIYHFIEILQSKEYKAGIMYGDPHSGENRSLTSGQSNASILRKYGFIFKSKRAPITERIGATRNIMERILVSDKCIITIEALSSWQFVKPKSGNTSSQTPQHNEYSHIADAVSYFCYNHTVKNSSDRNTKRKKVYSSQVSGVVG